MSWVYLVIAGLLEIIWAIGLKYTDGFTRLWPSLAVGSLYALAIWLMSLSVRHLEVGLAYAVWAGGGTALTAVVGMLWFGESFHSTRLIGLAFVVAGVICLNLDWR